MHLHKSLRLALLLSLIIGCGLVQAQPAYTMQYSVVTLDSTYAHHPDANMQAYINQHKAKLDSAMDQQIGFCLNPLSSYAPQSPLSNLLTDILYDIGNHYCLEHTGRPADMSLLNFGGIRTSMPAGKITVGTIYNILPFDNTIVIILLKGSELRKMFESKTLTSCQPYSHAQVYYEDNKPKMIKVNHRKLNDNKLYRLVTIDFIQTGGDKILEGVQFEEVIPTNYLLRTAVMDYIRNNGRGAMCIYQSAVDSKTDKRVMVKAKEGYVPEPLMISIY